MKTDGTPGDERVPPGTSVVDYTMVGEGELAGLARLFHDVLNCHEEREKEKKR